MPPKRGHEGEPPLKEIRELVDLMVSKGLAELEVSWGETRIRISRQTPPAPMPAWQPAAPMPAGAAMPAAMPAPTPAAAEAAMPGAANLVTIETPMVGTFYRAPAPDAPPYVKEGEAIKAGQVVCIIEAMKLMNEIESKVAGRVVKVLVENAQPVEYGQPLFLIEPV